MTDHLACEFYVQNQCLFIQLYWMRFFSMKLALLTKHKLILIFVCPSERFAQHKLNCMPHVLTNTHFSNFISINRVRLFFNLRLHCVNVCDCHISLHIFISCSIAISISCEFISTKKKTKIFSTRHTSQNSTFRAWMIVHDEEAHLNNNKFSKHALHSQLSVFMDCFIQFSSIHLFISR